MSCPIHIEFPGAVYNVTSRGDRRELIYRDNEDRVERLAVIAHAMDHFDARVQAYRLMRQPHCCSMVAAKSLYENFAGAMLYGEPVAFNAAIDTLAGLVEDTRPVSA
jgi:hypothetical protein